MTSNMYRKKINSRCFYDWKLNNKIFNKLNILYIKNDEKKLKNDYQKICKLKKIILFFLMVYKF